MIYDGRFFGTSLFENEKDEFNKLCPNGTIVKCDLTKENEIQNTVSKCIEKYGKIDVLLNNAAMKTKGPIEDFSVDVFKQAIDTNLVSIYSLIKKFLPYLEKCSNPRIINISSTLGKYAAPNRLPYTTIKHAILLFGQSLQRELISKGSKIGITTVFPGGMNTPWVDKEKEDYLAAEDVSESLYFIATRRNKILIPEFSIIPRGDKYL